MYMSSICKTMLQLLYAVSEKEYNDKIKYTLINPLNPMIL